MKLYTLILKQWFKSYHNQIIDYSFLRRTNSQETYIESLINPKTKFEKKITDITGIRPMISKINPQLKNMPQRFISF